MKEFLSEYCTTKVIKLCNVKPISRTHHHHHHHHCGYYSLLQALTAPIIFLHSSLSTALLFHPCTLKAFRSRSTPSIHLMFGLPTFRLPSMMVKVTLRHGSVSFSLYRCPSHLIRIVLIILIISMSPYASYSSLLYLMRQMPFSHIGPKIFLNIFLSNTPILFSCVFVRVQLSAPYVTTGLRRVLYSLILVCKQR